MIDVHFLLRGLMQYAQRLRQEHAGLRALQLTEFRQTLIDAPSRRPEMHFSSITGSGRRKRCILRPRTRKCQKSFKLLLGPNV